MTCARKDHHDRVCKCYSECLWCGRKRPDIELRNARPSDIGMKLPVAYECIDTEDCNKYIRSRILIGVRR